MNAFSLSDSQDAVEGTKRITQQTAACEDAGGAYLIQSGRKKNVKMPSRTVKIPSVRMSLHVHIC
jgi:hypothetical protein